MFVIIKIYCRFNCIYILSMIFIVAADCDNLAYFIDIIAGWDGFHYYFIVDEIGEVMMDYNNSWGKGIRPMIGRKLGL